MYICEYESKAATYIYAELQCSCFLLLLLQMLTLVLLGANSAAALLYYAFMLRFPTMKPFKIKAIKIYKLCNNCLMFVKVTN